ncbi:MAG TPA: hypothetical protein VFW79_09135 [Cellulomonas sp.]|uniref:restriction system modified-DNA reader domain-containing protein n=1 Tax=Cellulomonas sp. TaxID=40001 RepID=UPI002E30D7ED|nr:hypothetical protein [Cellulomonas sp.]HEX5332796.1 hypothetical protein [Cellulomonas sp.]
MPIFELDEGHPVLVQPMQPAPGTFAADSSALVAEHLASLLGEKLFPVRLRHGDAPGPHLLALDTTGRPVVVDVVQILDGDGLVRALQHAGNAARLSRADLLRTYEGGADMFDADFRDFRDEAPLSAAQTGPLPGARLLLVCAEVDPQVMDAVAFLREPGRQVEVLQIGVVRGVDGRRYVDVSPLVLRQPARRTVEPSSVRRVRHHAAPADDLASTPVPAPTAASHARNPVTAPTPAVPAAPPPPADFGGGWTADVLPAPAAVPALAELAQGHDAIVALVWFRERRGQRLHATLRNDGLIELPDGRVHASPDDAAADAANTEGTVDGWRAWRLGDGGPTLAEAAGAR